MKAYIFFGKVATVGNAGLADKVGKKMIKYDNRANRKAQRVAKRQLMTKRQSKKNLKNGDNSNRGNIKGNLMMIFNKNKNCQYRVQGMKLGRRLSRRFSRNVQVVSTPKRIRIAIDLSGVKKEDLKVQVSKMTHRVIISGGSESNLHINSMFSHIVPLPKKAIMAQVAVSVSKKGILIIKAPKDKAAKDELRTIPIEVGCGDVSAEPFDKVATMVKEASLAAEEKAGDK